MGVVALGVAVDADDDPLGGSYFVEALTDEMEQRCYEYFAKIDELGGMVDAVKQSYPQREIADASFALQQEIDAGRRIVVGVNSFTEGGDGNTPLHRVDPSIERRQVDRLRTVRARRDSGAVEASLATLKRQAAEERRNLMPELLDAARAHVSEGEIVQALQEVWGDYRDVPVF